jgi:hypothetical protein
MLAKSFASGNRGREVLVVTTPKDADALRQNYHQLIGGTVHVSTDGVEGLVEKIVAGTSGL